MRLLRRIVDGTTLFVGRLKRRQIKDIPPQYASPAKVNVGCGLAICQGWINIDGSMNALIANLPKLFHRLAYRLTGAKRYYSEEDYCRLLGNHYFIHHDLAYGLPLAAASVDFLYSSHFLEHLPCADGERLLREGFRVLKPGGTIRIVVPDLEYALSLYASGRKKEMLGQYFFIDDDSHYARHKYMYDFALLSEALQGAGFRDVRRCAFRQGLTPDLDGLDNRAEESLFVEATR
jgi:predicted SAM-dependent methyltransferase